MLGGVIAGMNLTHAAFSRTTTVCYRALSGQTRCVNNLVLFSIKEEVGAICVSSTLKTAESSEFSGGQDI